MIRCPKCQFEQPEDIYCAQCGVNMKSFVPPKKSLILSLLFNQVFLIGLLFLAIVVFVIYDYSTSKKTALNVDSVAKQTSQPLRSEDPIPPEPPPPAQTPAAQPIPPTPVAAAKINRPRATDLSIKAADDDSGVGTTTAPSAKDSLQISFYQISRGLMADLQKEATSSQISGDGFGGLLNKKRLDVLKKSGDMKLLSGNRYKLDGHAISLFKGQQSSDNSKNIGLYFQINPLRHEASATQIEVKSWGSIKAQDPDETLFTSEMTLNNQSVAFITNFLPRDKVLNEEERSVFESERVLKIYDRDEFWDNSIDLVMFIELPD